MCVCLYLCVLCVCVCVCVCVVLLGHNTKQKAKYISFSPSWSKAFEKSCPSQGSALFLLRIQLKSVIARNFHLHGNIPACRLLP